MKRLLVAIAIGGSSVGAAAQTYRPAPALIPGEITPADTREGQDRPFDEYPVELAAGQRITVEASAANASELDPMLELWAPGARQPVASDDNGGGGTAARLSYTVGAQGLYRVRVLGIGDSRGRYRLRLSAAAPAGGQTGSGGSLGTGGGGSSGATGGVGGIGSGGATPPRSNRPLFGATGPAPHPTGSAAPRERFIICPGHPRCPR